MTGQQPEAVRGDSAHGLRRFAWRLAFIVGFLPLGLPLCLWLVGTLLVAAVAWVLFGPGTRDGKDRAERWAFGRVSTALDWPLDKLMRKADVLRELWT